MCTIIRSKVQNGLDLLMFIFCKPSVCFGVILLRFFSGLRPIHTTRTNGPHAQAHFSSTCTSISTKLAGRILRGNCNTISPQKSRFLARNKSRAISSHTGSKIAAGMTVDQYDARIPLYLHDDVSILFIARRINKPIYW